MHIESLVRQAVQRLSVGPEGDRIALLLRDLREQHVAPRAAVVSQGKALHFELPLLAEVDGDILTGLADLVVDHEDGTTTVIDFKAGTHFAQQGAEGSIDVPGLSGYCWQLEAYKTALEAAGRTVKETGLVYVRGPSWVRF
jgi:hypothetical protein